jgi:hypothetical protein
MNAPGGSKSADDLGCSYDRRRCLLNRVGPGLRRDDVRRLFFISIKPNNHSLGSVEKSVSIWLVYFQYKWLPGRFAKHSRLHNIRETFA